MTGPAATPAELARQRQLRQAALARVAAGEAGEAWQQIDPADIARSWAGLLERPLAATTGAQLLAVQGVDDYVDEVLTAAGDAFPPAGRIEARAFAGIASDGRALETLLYQPAITSLQAIAAGAPPDRALALGRTHLDMIVRTQVADAGRAATGAAVAARGCGYTRHLTPPSCSRCAVLAGKFYRWNAGFQRHPRCDCIHVPCTPGFSKHLTVSPRGYFDSLSAAEQDRIFTRAGADAIRDGADIGQVVNARRGMQTAGGRRTTTESTSRHGVARRGRLMPEQIYADAKGDRDEAVRLLREHGYIAKGVPTPKRLTFDERVDAAAQEAEALAAAPLSITRAEDLRRMSSDERSVLSQYKGSLFSNLNGALRREKGQLPGTFGFDYLREASATLDKLLRRSKLTSEVLVFRGIKDGAAVFGEEAWGRSLVGGGWTEHGYLSTSADLLAARNKQFLTEDGATIAILVPRRVGALQLSGPEYESELLLQRGLRLRVVTDSGPGTDRIIEVEVLA